jgi:hypothetical protein
MEQPQLLSDLLVIQRIHGRLLVVPETTSRPAPAICRRGLCRFVLASGTHDDGPAEAGGGRRGGLTRDHGKRTLPRCGYPVQRSSGARPRAGRKRRSVIGHARWSRARWPTSRARMASAPEVCQGLEDPDHSHTRCRLTVPTGGHDAAARPAINGGGRRTAAAAARPRRAATTP